MSKVIFVFGLMGILLLQGCKPMTAPDFQNLKLPKFPNYYLVCPKDYCNVTPSAYTSIYPVPAEDLFDAFNQMIAQQPRTNFVYSMPETGQYTLIQKTPVGWVDDISVQFIALPNNQSTLAIISKSRYGLYDFGMNKKRLNQWLLALGQIVMSNAQTTVPQTTPAPSAVQTAAATNASSNNDAIINQSSAASAETTTPANSVAADTQQSATTEQSTTSASPTVVLPEPSSSVTDTTTQ